MRLNFALLFRSTEISSICIRQKLLHDRSVAKYGAAVLSISVTSNLRKLARGCKLHGKDEKVTYMINCIFMSLVVTTAIRILKGLRLVNPVVKLLTL